MKSLNIFIAPCKNNVWNRALYLVVAIPPLIVLPAVFWSPVLVIILVSAIITCIIQAIRPTRMGWLLIFLINLSIFMLCTYYLIDQYQIYLKDGDQDHNEFEGWESFLKYIFFIIEIAFTSGLLTASFPRKSTS